MFKLLRFTISSLLALSFMFPAAAQEGRKARLSNDIFVEEIGDGVWRHVSSKNVPQFGLVESNGLIVKAGSEALLVDSAWSDEQTKIILDWIEKELKARVSMAVVTHYHGDRLGGIREIHKRGIRTISSALTAEYAKRDGLPSPKQTFDGRIRLTLDGREIIAVHPGAGHSRDNIVVWVPDSKVLFGGCLIKSAQSKSLGNIADADLEQWPKTVGKVMEEFKQARIVVPGHGDVAGVDAIENTLQLLKKQAGRLGRSEIWDCGAGTGQVARIGGAVIVQVLAGETWGQALQEDWKATPSFAGMRRRPPSGGSSQPA